MTDQPKTLGINAESGAYALSGGSVELWKYGTHAPAWFADAKQQVILGDDQARRREIIFAVCAVESYLFEWVRDKVLNGEFRLLTHYFPVSQRPIGIVERWKLVINHLLEDGSMVKSHACCKLVSGMPVDSLDVYH